MELTQAHLDLASDAYIASLDGKGLVIRDDLYPEADDLAQAGWLERYFRDGELCWRWSPRAEVALAVNGLIEDQSPN